ncbi:formylglycine-generating enzyme family protein [Spirosoma aerolatum]|uniref:formylglycine-generating enzyme family protein n=1 Tax=Spirosoma aerolatum TaxID=1211326 RepID=UPI0009ADA933|nr:formylglycine-generating enzyme family protein [Spirosoma aerolatum]
MKSWLNYFTGLLILVSHNVFGQQAVYINAREKGTGILKSRTSECFVITPAHVVKAENRPFMILGARNTLSRGEKVREYESDLAITRIIDGGTLNCEDWNVDPNYEEILAKTNEGFLETAQTNGGVKSMQVFISEKDETTITVRSRFSNDKIIKGMSGSLLFTSKNGDKVYLGMLLEVSGDDEGIVLQASKIDKVISSFFEIKPAAKGKAINPTVSQANRYKSMISTIDELLPNATKAYDLFTDVIWKHHDCDVVEQAVKINKIIGLSLKSLTTKIYEDEALVKESNFNIRPIKDLILEIDQWDKDYNQLADKRKSPCKMPMFAAMQYLMLRGDLIELKAELNQRLNIKDLSSKPNEPVNNQPTSIKSNPTKSDLAKPKAKPSQIVSTTRRFLNLPFADMVYVPGGTFRMGDDEGESDEKPAHNVTLNSFFMGKYEVTQGQWEKIMGNNPSHQKEPKAFSKEDCSECPVEQVSWKDTQEFLKKLNALTGENYRLPTEAEWEYAAGGGAGKRTRFGNGQDVLTQKQANYDQLANQRTDDYFMRTMKVGSFPPNRLGLHDMAGNVWEWCNDWSGDYPDFDKVNPTGPSTGTRRTLRGGSYSYPPKYCEITHRTTQSPSHTFIDIGFRIVLSAP